MNKNFLKSCFPSIPSSFTHYLNNDAQFISADYDSQPPKGKIEINSTVLLKKDSTVILLEYGIGYKGLWSKVLVDDKMFYVESNFLTTAPATPQLFPYNSQIDYQPNENAPDIYWKDQQINVVYEDKKRGNFCVHLEVDVTSFENDEILKKTVEQACYDGTALILKSKGFKHDTDFVTELINKYYLFSRAEEFYFPLRPCSTFRVFVTLPTRFLYAKNDNNNYILAPEDLQVVFVSPELNASIVSETGEGTGPKSGQSSENDENSQEDSGLIKLVYNNKSDLDIHFSYVLLNLAWYSSIFYFPPGRIWKVLPTDTPDIVPGVGALNIPIIQNRLGNLYKQINEFIYKNALQQAEILKDDVGKKIFKDIYKVDYESVKPKKDPNDLEKFIDSVIPDSFSLTDLLSVNSTQALEFNGELQISIDKNNLQLKDITFFRYEEKNNLDRKVVIYRSMPLDVDRESFFKHESVLNKTSLNYLININPPPQFVENIKNNLKTLSERKDVTEFGKFVNGLLNTLDVVLSIPEALLGQKDQMLETFLINNHYPKVFSVFGESIDYGTCIDKFGDTMEKRISYINATYKPEEKIKQINKFKEDVENYKKGGGSNLFVQSLSDYRSIPDKNFQILIGNIELDGNQTLNQSLAAINLFDWPRFLRESINCSSAKFDPQSFNNILNDYERFKTLARNPDLLLTCNPLSQKVQSVLDQISNFSLPNMPIYNPQNSLINQLKQLSFNIINDLIVFAIRGLITGALKDCTRDNNPDNSNPNDTNSPKQNNLQQINNNIDNISTNNRDIDAFFNDYFGLDDTLKNQNNLLSNNNEANTDSDNKQNIINNQFKPLLKSFLEDVIACLTTKELCILLTGGRIDEDAYDVIFSILRRKYNTPQNKFNLAAKLNSKQQIEIFFTKLKNNYNLSICEDVAADASPIFPKDPICDDGRKRAVEEALLKDKGLSDEDVKALLDDIKEKDEEDLRKVLDFLNSDNPFDLSNIPTVLCKKGPNGEVMPPLLSVAPPLKSFNSLVDGMYKQIYDNFDEDASTWYKDTYSVSSPTPKNNLIWENDKLKFDNSKRGKSDTKFISDINLPSYIFKSFLENNNNTNIQQPDNLLEAVLDGYKEQELAINYVTKQNREQVEIVNKNLKLFCESLFHLLDTYTILASTNRVNNFSDKPELNSFLQNQFSVFIKLLGSFYANSPAVYNNPDKNAIVKRVLNFKESDYANAFFAEENSVSLIDAVKKFFDDSTFLSNLKNTIDALKLNSVDVIAVATTGSNITYTDPNLFLSQDSDLLKNYSNTNLFKATQQVMNSYPTYNVTLKNTSSFIDNNKMYDKNIFIINKNGFDYINREINNQVDDSVFEYITQTLNFSQNAIPNITKKDIYNKFITICKRNFNTPDSIHTSSLAFSLKKKDEKIFDEFGFIDYDKDKKISSFSQPNFKGIRALLSKQMDNNILSSEFLNTSTVAASAPQADGGNGQSNFPNKDDDKKMVVLPDFNDTPKNNLPITQYMTLVVKQTPTQKACNIRPHYLEVDYVKSEISKAKEQSYCLEEPKNEKIKAGEEISSDELPNIDLTDDQSIILDGNYKLYLRTQLHEIMLRAIGVYGYYEPQTIRKNDLFLTVMTDMLEAEIRASDNTLFLMIISFLEKQYKFKNPNSSNIPEYNLLLKEFVKSELKNYVLPKMSKRINEDTNAKLATLTPPKKITLRTADDFYNEKNNILYINPTKRSVYIRVTGTRFKRLKDPLIPNSKDYVLDTLEQLLSKQENANLDLEIENLKYSQQEIYFQKIYESNENVDSLSEQEALSRIISDFKNSVEYKLLFNYLFPLNDQLVFRHFAAAFGCATRKSATNSFKTVKQHISMISKFTTTNGVDIKPNLANFQDMSNSDDNSIFVKYIIGALVTAPLLIVKSFTELTEPNISLSSKLYLLTKSFIPETPSLMIPAISFPLGIPIPPVFPLGIVPWVNIPLALFYLIGGLWYENDLNFQFGSQQKEVKTDLINRLTDVNINLQAPQEDCSKVINPDVIRVGMLPDGEAGYDYLNPSQLFTSISQQALEQAQAEFEQDIKNQSLLRVQAATNLQQWTLDEVTMGNKKQSNILSSTSSGDSNQLTNEQSKENQEKDSKNAVREKGREKADGKKGK